MRLTYGDSSETELDFDPLALTRSVVEYACDVMRAAQRVEHRRASQSRAGAQAAAWSKKAGDLHGRLCRLLGPEVADVELRADLEQSMADAVHRHTGRRRDAANREQQRLDEEIAYERQRCLEALEPLLCSFTLPETSARLRLRNHAASYHASLFTTTELAGAELRAEFRLDVGSSFASGNRTVRSFKRHAELRVPVRRWFGRRGAKLRDLSECVIQALDHSADGTVAVLRAAGRRPVDYRIERNDEGLAVAAADDRAIGTLELVGDDARAASDLLDALVVPAIPLTERRTKLRAAQLSETDVTELCDVEIVALQLIEAVAPIVREVWERSARSDELVIGVPSANGTTEVRSLALSTLRDALAPLEPNQRGVFSAWGLPLAGAPMTGAPLPRSGRPQSSRLARGSMPPETTTGGVEHPAPSDSDAAPRPSTGDLDSGWA